MGNVQHTTSEDRVMASLNDAHHIIQTPTHSHMDNRIYVGMNRRRNDVFIDDSVRGYFDTLEKEAWVGTCGNITEFKPFWKVNTPDETYGNQHHMLRFEHIEKEPIPFLSLKDDIVFFDSIFFKCYPKVPLEIIIMWMVYWMVSLLSISSHSLLWQMANMT